MQCKSRAYIAAAFLAVVAFLVFLTGCGFFSDKEYSVRYDISEPKNLDPQTADSEDSITVISNIFEGLFVVDDLGEIKNGYAQSYEKSDDGLKYKFIIKEGEKWENGEEVTAYDFEFALQRLLKPETNSKGAEKFFCIKNAQSVHNGEINASEMGVKAADAKTLNVELEIPNNNFLELLASSYAYPCNEKFFDGTKGKYGLSENTIMANGAFTLKTWKDKYIYLSKNQNYYDNQNVLPSGVTLNFAPISERAERLLNEKSDAGFVDGESVSRFGKKGFNLQPLENETIGLVLNCQSGALKNKNIRNAISVCFDRSSYANLLPEHLAAAYGIIPHGILVGGQPFRDAAGDSAAPEYDEEKAIKLYKKGAEETGATGFETFDMIINSETMPEMAEIFSHPSQIIQKACSIYINAHELSDAEYQARLKGNDYDIAVVSLGSADRSPLGIFSPFTTQGGLAGFNSVQYDVLLKETYLSTEKEEKLKGYQMAEELLISNAVFIPVAYLTDYFAEAPKASQIEYNQHTGSVIFKRAVIK